jgi:lysozyme family protein
MKFLEAILELLRAIFDKKESILPEAKAASVPGPKLLSSKGKHSEKWASMRIRESWAQRVYSSADSITRNRARYEKVQEKTGVPWFIVGVIHMRESTFDFSKHLHNGDSLKARTHRVPAGRPRTGAPPFTWDESAVDALEMKRGILPSIWTVETALELLERYNGLGYRNKGVPSPYIWSGSFHYTRGKYVADGKYSSTFVDGQVGVAPVLKVLQLRGLA